LRKPGKMFHYKYTLYISFLLQFLLAGSLFAQVPQTAAEIAKAPSGDNAKLLYRHEKSTGIIFHSNGWGINHRVGKHLTGTKKRQFEFEYVSMGHPKQTRISLPGSGKPKSFAFGKLNSVGVLRTGIGLQKVIYGKENQNSVEIRYSVYGGPSIGMAKPVYLEITYQNVNGTDNPILLLEKYDPTKHTSANIVGKAPFIRGLSEVKFHPGLYGKFGLSFEYGSYDDVLRILETGFVVDYYPNPIEIMAFNKAKPYFFSLYINLLFGKKWF
jgi:hypothetical protein